MIVIQITITLCLCQLSTSPSFQPNKITFDTRVVWPRKQGRGRGGILTFSKLSVQVIKLKEKHFFLFSLQVFLNCWSFPRTLEASCRFTWTGPVLSRTKASSLSRERRFPCQTRCQSCSTGCAAGTSIPTLSVLDISQNSYLSLPFLCPDQFCGIVEEVYNPTFSCYENMIKFPHCVSEGQITNVSTELFVSCLIFRYQKTEPRAGLDRPSDQRSHQGTNPAALPSAGSRGH